MIKNFQLLLLIPLLILTACSDDKQTITQENRAQENSESEHVWSTQVQSLEKAKGVEQIINNRVNQQQQKIDGQSN